MHLNGIFRHLCFFLFFFSPLHSIVYHSHDDHYAFLEMAKKFPSVGMLSLQFKSKDNKKLVRSYCSGVLIDPLTVITIADCVNPLLKDEFEFDRDTNYFGANTFKLGDDVYNKPIAMAKIKGAMFYPGHKHDNLLTEAQNLALLFLEKPIYSVEPARLYPMPMEGFSQTFSNKKVVMVGFGFHGLPYSPYLPKNDAYLPSKKEIDFNKRACVQKIKGFSRSTFETHFSIDGDELQGMFTHADQGGGMFMEFNGVWHLVGINSHRINPTLRGEEKKPDERDVSYETKGISLAIPSYSGWIKENQALRTAKRSSAVDNSEWTFPAYWKKGAVPHNSIADSALYHADINTSSTIIVDNFISLHQLTLRHKNATLFIPPMLSVKLSKKEVGDHLQKIWGSMDDDTAKSLDNDEKFAVIEYERGLIYQNDSDEISRMLKMEVRTLNAEAGVLDVNGELWGEHFHLHGGKLTGTGSLIYSVSPVVNTGATVVPGTRQGVGTLTMIGDYEQHSGRDGALKDEASLVIRVAKKGRNLTNSVLNVRGEARLGGALVIEEVGGPLIHNDRIKFLHGKNRGKFDRVVLPRTLSYEMLYQGDFVTLVVKDPLWQQNVVIQGGKMAITGPKFVKSLTLIDGVVTISGRFKLSDGPFSVTGGTLKLVKEREPQNLCIVGDYEQSGGTLKLRIQKNLVEILDEKEFVVDVHGNLVPLSEAGPASLEKRIVQKFGTPEYEWKSDMLTISKTAKLGGHLELDFGGELLLKEGVEIPLITAEKIEGTFESISKLPGLIQPILLYEENRVILTFKNMGTLANLSYSTAEARLAARILDLERMENKKSFAALFLVLHGLSEKGVEDMITSQVIPSKAFKRLLHKYEQQEDLIGEENIATLRALMAL